MYIFTGTLGVFHKNRVNQSRDFYTTFASPRRQGQRQGLSPPSESGRFSAL